MKEFDEHLHWGELGDRNRANLNPYYPRRSALCTSCLKMWDARDREDYSFIWKMCTEVCESCIGTGYAEIPTYEVIGGLNERIR